MDYLKYGTADALQGKPLIEAGSNNYEVNPTLAVGDAKISKDGGAFANLATLPDVYPAGGRAVRITFSAAELQCKQATVQIIDQTSPKEWEDQTIIVYTHGHENAQINFKHLSIHEWHVAKTGNDNNFGHCFEDAKLTIMAAVNAAVSGDTIIIHPGDYDEQVNVGAKSLTLMGTDRHRCRIANATAWGIGITCHDGTTIRNLAISMTGATGICQAVLADSKSDIVIEDCDLYGSGDSIGLTGSCQNILLRNCSLKSNYDVLAFIHCKGLVVDNCLLYTDGSWDDDDHRSQAIKVAGTGYAVFNNCIFRVEVDTTDASDIYGVAVTGAAKLAFNNCVFVVTAGVNDSGSISGVYTEYGDGKVVLNNCVFKTSTAGGGSAYDLYNQAGTIYISNSLYFTTFGTIIDVVSTIFGKVGITEGGNWDLTKALKVLNAWIAGNWRDKGGGVQELLDADDGTTVILEMVLSKSSPYRSITIRI